MVNGAEDEIFTTVTNDRTEDKTAPWSCRRPTIYWGWVVTVASSITFVVSYGTVLSFGIVMVELMEQFNSSATKTGYIGTTAYGFSSISCLITAPLNVYLGYRIGAMLGLASCIVSCIMTSFAPDLSLMFVSHGILYGFGASMIVCGCINITVSYFPGKHQSLATGVCSAGTNLGTLIMSPAIYAISASLGWRNIFRIISAILFVVGLPAILTFSPAPTTSSPPTPTASSSGYEAVDEVDTETPLTSEKSTDPHINMKDAGQVTDRTFLDEQKLKGRCCGAYDESIRKNNNCFHDVMTETVVTRSGVEGPTVAESSGMLVANGPNSRRHLLDSSNDKRHQKPTQECHANGVSVPCFESGDSGKDSEERIAKGVLDDSGEQKNTYWGKLFSLLQMPDVWLLEIGLFTAAIGLSFLMFSTANVIVTSGFSKKTASLVLAVMGFSEFIGKFVIGIVSDRLPIPKIFIFMAANCVGALLIIVMSFVETKAYIFTQATVQGFFVLASLDSLPHSLGNQLYSSQYSIQLWAMNMFFMGIGGILGAVFGESVDRTGSYNAAFYACIAIFLISTAFLGLCVVQQRVFARDRFFVFSKAGKRYARIKQNDSGKEKRLEFVEELTSGKENGLGFSSSEAVEYLTSV